MTASALHSVTVKHQTCTTSKGQRRFPAAGVSYDIDETLFDNTTQREYYRPHTDGTEVIYSQVYSNEQDAYSDRSQPVADRATLLINDLYAANKSDKERIRAYGQIAIPNNITDAEMTVLADKLGEMMTTSFRRPVILGVHKKTGNNHIHFSIAERELKKGKWMGKRKKIYKDIDGNLIYNKVYKDVKGWDIRKPVIDKKRVPDGIDPYIRDAETGDYIFQKLDNRNRKQWESDTREGKFFEPAELSKFHDEVDKVINAFLQEHDYDITVRRNKPEVTQFLKDNDLEQLKIGVRNTKTKNESYQDIQTENQRRMTLQREFEKVLDDREAAADELEKAEKREEQQEEAVKIAIDYTKEIKKEKEKADKEYLAAVTDYVENELLPEQIFVNDYMEPYQQALTFKDEQCAAASDVLQVGIDKTNDMIEELESKEERSDRENNKLEFLQNNKKSFVSVSNEILRIKKQDKTQDMRQTFRQKWNGLTGWQRAKYIYTTVSKTAGILYHDYLAANGEISPEKNPDFSLPDKVTSEKTIAGIINGKSVPGIKSKFDKNLSAQQNARNATETTLKNWKENINQEIPLPPAASDFEFLTLANTAPERIRELNTQPDKLHFFRAQPKDYQPEQDKQRYLDREQEIKEEAERNVWNQKKDRSLLLTAISEKLKAVNKIIDKVIDTEYWDALKRYDKEVTAHMYNDMWSESKTYVKPQEPTRETVAETIRKDLMNPANWKKLHQLANKESISLTAYGKAMAEYNKYHKLKPADPDDPATGKNTQQTKRIVRKRETPTLVLPDRQRGKDRGGR